MGVSQERRAKLVIAILVVLAILLLFGAVGVGVVGSGESAKSKWPVLFMAVSFGFLLVVGTIIEVLQRKPSRSYHAVRAWHWLFVPANGAFVGLAFGLAANDRGFWPGFLVGFALGTLLLGFALLLNTVPPAVRRFAKPS